MKTPKKRRTSLPLLPSSGKKKKRLSVDEQVHCLCGFFDLVGGALTNKSVLVVCWCRMGSHC